MVPATFFVLVFHLHERYVFIGKYSFLLLHWDGEGPGFDHQELMSLTFMMRRCFDK